MGAPTLIRLFLLLTGSVASTTEPLVIGEIKIRAAAPIQLPAR